MISQDLSGRRLRAIGLLLAVIVPLLAAIAVGLWLPRPSSSAADAAAPPEVAGLETLERGFTWIADTIKPSVVFVEVEQTVGGAVSLEEEPEPDIPEQWRDLLPPGFPWTPREAPRGRPEPQMPTVGQGSGVVIDPAGYIITNRHVVAEATKITVHLADGELYPAEVTGVDELTDLAVIKIEPKRPLVAAKLGNAEEAKVGSWAMAVGYPFGGSSSGGRFDEPLRYEPTVTVGVISATNRQIPSHMSNRPFRNLIQTDAPINRGNSGGPLVNIRAEVIGINQAIFTSTPWGGNIGVGFAIPINEHTQRILETLKGGETVVRGQLGVLVAPLTPALKAVYGAEYGVFVEEVLPDSPAAEAGVRAEDIVTAYDGRKVTSQDEFVGWVQGTRPDTSVTIELLRDGRPLKLKAKVGTLSPVVASKEPSGPEHNRLGLSVESMPEDQLRKAGLSGGVRVVSVDPLGDAGRAGLEEGDVIVKINRQEVADLRGYQEAVEALKKGDPVVIRVWRAGRTRTAQIDSLAK
jgi:serine protease Do